jgi:hypothetical protein
VVEGASGLHDIQDGRIDPNEEEARPLHPSLFPRLKAGVGDRSPSRRFAGEVEHVEHS